jgi:tRNA 2-thiouridine synthesizing protein E
VSSFEQSGSPPRKYIRSIAGRDVMFDQEGFLWQPDDWCEEIAEVLARESGLESLGEKHWLVLRFLREFYYNNGRAPLNRHLAKGTALSLLEIEKLFPGGIKYGARRIAGLPNPKKCL